MDASIFREPRVEALIAKGLARSRLSMATRAERLRDKSWHIAQCSFAAAVSWAIAAGALGHQAPIFAPIVALVCLGMTYGQRLRRVAEVTVGVAVGLAVADVFVSVAGAGVWQMALVVTVAMGTALLLDAGLLLVMQSAVQSVTVVALAQTSGGFNRWIDAVVGGGVALFAAAVVPRAPLREPRRQAARVAARIGELLRDAADSATTGDVEHAASVLAQARSTDELIRELQAAADEGMAVIASAPWRRSDEANVRGVAAIVDPLDRALRSTRVLVRRVSIAAHHGATIPARYAEVLRELAEATDVIGRVWAESHMADRARPALLAVAESTATLTPNGYHTTVLLGQLRSLVVDLLELTGLDHEDAVAAVPAGPGGS